MPLYRTDPGAVYGRAQSALQTAGNTMSQQTKKTTKKVETSPTTQVANYIQGGVGTGLMGLTAYEKFDKYFGSGKEKEAQTAAQKGVQAVKKGAEAPAMQGAEQEAMKAPTGGIGNPQGTPNVPAGGKQLHVADTPPQPTPTTPPAPNTPVSQTPAGGIAPKTPTGNPVKSSTGNLGTVNQSDAGPANAARAFETNVGRDKVASLPGMESPVADQSLNAGVNGQAASNAVQTMTTGGAPAAINGAVPLADVGAQAANMVGGVGGGLAETGGLAAGQAAGQIGSQAAAQAASQAATQVGSQLAAQTVAQGAATAAGALGGAAGAGAGAAGGAATGAGVGAAGGPIMAGVGAVVGGLLSNFFG